MDKHEQIFENVLKETQCLYKDSKEAFFEKEEGNENELVTVVDNFTDGTSIEFTWYRGKSNDNRKDLGDGKQGFTFYFARYAFRDPYKWKRSDLVSDNNNTAYLGRVYKTVEKEMLVIQSKEIEKGKIHIISATYVTIPEIERDYYKRALGIQEREKGIKKHLTELTGNKAIKEALTYLKEKIYEPLTPIRR